MKKKKSVKKRIVIRQILILSILIILIVLATKYVNRGNINVEAKENQNIVKQTIIKDIEENDDVLINPGKGCTYESTINSSFEEMISVGYIRYDWSYIEPEEGKYNWNLIDKDINYYKSKGKKFAFGVMCANTSLEEQYVTPKWVFDAGAKGRNIEVTFWYNNLTHTQTIPVWTDKIFLEKLNHFIEALAKRYDGNDDIAYIDIRSYGNWGEQHNGEIGGNDITSKQLKELYIKPYIDNFKNTLLVNPWGKEEYNDTYKWAIKNGVTIRRDGIFKYSDGSECLMAYGKLPTIYEYTEKYEWIKENGYWSQDTLLKYVETGKPSYIQFDAKMYEENKEFCRMIANKIGYYFKLKQVKYTNAVTKEKSTTIELKFKNEGVAPLYESAYVYIGLLDDSNNLVKKYITNVNPQNWEPDKEITEKIKIKFSDVQNGSYNLAVGLFLNENDENPTYLLGNEGKTSNNWYVFGKINICNEEQIIENTTNEQKNPDASSNDEGKIQVAHTEEIKENSQGENEQNIAENSVQENGEKTNQETRNNEKETDESEGKINNNETSSKEIEQNAENMSKELKTTEKINGIWTSLNLDSSTITKKSKIVVTTLFVIIILMILIAAFLLFVLIHFLYNRYFKKIKKCMKINCDEVSSK